MNKNVWILNHYAGGMYFDRGGRHYNFAKYLRRAGYEPVVFCCNAKHGSAETFFEDKALWQEHTAEEIDTPFVFVRGRTYTGNGKQRVLNMADFYRNVQTAAAEYARLHGKPDVVYASSVHPLTLVAGLRLAKRFGVKCICEVRDLWPESIVIYSDRWTRKSLLMRLLYQGEKRIYKKADALIFTMEGGYDYITGQGWEREIPRDKVFYINNGVDLEAFDANREQFRLDDPELDDPAVFKVVYTGSIRRVNRVGHLLDVAKEVRDARIRFLFWGDGDEREALEQRVRDEGIGNVSFKGRVDKNYIPSVVSRADLNIAHAEMSDLLRFGPSYNKLFEYLAAGKPIFSTLRPNPRYSPIEQGRCGKDAVGFTPRELAQGLEELAALSEAERAELGRNARKTAEQYDFANLTKKLIDVLESL